MRSIIVLTLTLLIASSLTQAQPAPTTAPTTARALAPTSGPAEKPTTVYTRLYVFGDSYSDIGAGYVDGDGPTAVAYLGWHMGLSVTHAKAPRSSEKSLVFAVSGARTGEGRGNSRGGALLGYGMMNQVRDFETRVKSGEIKFDPDTTLFFFAGGLNDRGLPIEATLGNLQKQLEIVKSLGGKHFTIALMPVKIRQFVTAGTRLNPSLPKFVEDNAKGMNIDLWLNHWGEYFDDVMVNPANYGITNTTNQNAGRLIFDQDPTPVADPATYFFYHEGHPSTAVHRAVGKRLFEELKARLPAPVKRG